MSEIVKIEENVLQNCKAYRLLQQRQKVHEDYGLWIFLAHTNCVSHGHTVPCPRYFEFYNISHMWKGDGWFWTPDGGVRALAAGQAVCLAPGLIHDYNGRNGYVEDFVCFAGPVADQLYRSGIIRPGITRLGPVRELLPIIELASDPGRTAQIKANLALQNLLVKLHLENNREEEPPQGGVIEKLQQSIISYPEKWWTVAEMAEAVNLSVNQFIRVFSRHTGLTPKKYLDAVKIKLAAGILHHSSEPLAVLASRLGYRDPFHFSKRFKQITGISPTEYRRQYCGIPDEPPQQLPVKAKTLDIL